jgi:hypothetical protein
MPITSLLLWRKNSDGSPMKRDIYVMARRYERAGEIAMTALICAAVAYELTFEDLLSMATERWCAKRPVLTRVAILAVAGHLAYVMPRQLDVFHADNVFYRYVKWVLT